MGLEEIPILALYEKDYWPNELSTMIRGISIKKFPNFNLTEYTNIDDVENIILNFVKNIR